MDGREGFEALAHVVEGWVVGQAVPIAVIIAWVNGGPAQCGRDVEIQSAGRLPAAPCVPLGHKTIKLGVISDQCTRGVFAEGALVDRIGANELIRIKQHTQGRVHGVGYKEQPFQETRTLSAVWGRAQAAVAIGQPKQNSACFKDGSMIRFQRWDQAIGVQGHVGIRPLRRLATVDEGAVIGRVNVFQRKADHKGCVIRGVVQDIAHALMNRADGPIGLSENDISK